MKIAVTSKGTDLNSKVDARFGLAEYILIVDTFSLSVDVIENSKSIDPRQNAGVRAAAAVRDKGAYSVLTGFCGFEAYQTLNEARIKVANQISGTVMDAVKAFNEGRVAFADSSPPSKQVK